MDELERKKVKEEIKLFLESNRVSCPLRTDGYCNENCALLLLTMRKEPICAITMISVSIERLSHSPVNVFKNKFPTIGGANRI